MYPCVPITQVFRNAKVANSFDFEILRSAALLRQSTADSSQSMDKHGVPISLLSEEMLPVALASGRHK